MPKKKIPMRKCVVSQEMRPKKEMVRIVRNKDGEVSIDPTGKKNGRGAYVSLSPELISQAKQKDLLGKALNCKVPSDFYDELFDYIEHKNARVELENG